MFDVPPRVISWFSY